MVFKKYSMKRILIIISLALLMPYALNAQLWKVKRYEISGSVGITQFYGDIGGYSSGENLLGIKDFTFNNTRYNITANLRYKILENVYVRLNMAFGTFHSTDAKGSHQNRKFESSTLFFEPALICEYYIIKNRSENSFLFIKGYMTGYQSFFQTLDFYAFTGYGGILYKVKPNDSLKPYVAELTGLKPVVPLGIGMKMNYSTNFKIGVEFGARFVFSDRIDGFTSLSSKASDKYHFLNLTFTYKIKTGPKGHAKFRKNL